MSEFHDLRATAARAERDLHANLHRAIVDAMPPIVVGPRADTSGYVAALEEMDVIDVESRIVPPTRPGRVRRALERLWRR